MLRRDSAAKPDEAVAVNDAQVEHLGQQGVLLNQIGIGCGRIESASGDLVLVMKRHGLQNHIDLVEDGADMLLQQTRHILRCRMGLLVAAPLFQQVAHPGQADDQGGDGRGDQDIGRAPGPSRRWRHPPVR